MAGDLTLTERECLYRWKQEGHSQAKIAELLHRDPGTVSREWQRNREPGGYQPEEAQRLAEARRQNCGRRSKMEDPEVREYVEQKLSQWWSPDRIAGRMRRESRGKQRRQVSHQTIYAWINRRAPHWKAYLRRGGTARNS